MLRNLLLISFATVLWVGCADEPKKEEGSADPSENHSHAHGEGDGEHDHSHYHSNSGAQTMHYEQEKHWQT